jgi:hypothetical protein
MSQDPYFFRIFDLKKYREIEPVIIDILNSSVDAERLEVLLKEAINIIESDEFKKYNDKSMRFDFDVFQSMINLINENRFEEWTDKKDDKWDEFYPENVAIHLVEILCCPKYQLYYSDNLPQSEMTLEYMYGVGAFYSFEKDIFSILRETGTESLPFKRGLCFFNPRQLAKFSKIISDDYELLRDPENTLYAIFKKKIYDQDSSFDQDTYVVSELFSRPPTLEELGEKYYALPDPIRQSKMICFYEKIIDLLRLASPKFTIVNDFWFVN